MSLTRTHQQANRDRADDPVDLGEVSALSPSSRLLWWLRPLPVLALIVIPSALAAFMLSPDVFWQQWKEPKIFSSKDLIWCLWATLVLAGGIVLGKAFVGRRSEANGGPREMPEVLSVDRLRSVFRVLYFVTLFGYVVWIGVAYHRGVRVRQIVQALERHGSAVYFLKRQLTSVSGVTTIVEVGVAAGIVGSYLLFVHGDRSVRRSLFILVGIAFVRSILNSERLALIEVVVPIAIVWATASWTSGRMSSRRRWRLTVIPLIAPLLLVVYFGGSEYFRSYAHYSQTQNTGLWQFSVARIEGYYATSYNNGSIIVRYYAPPTRVPYFTVEGVWKSPVMVVALPYSRVAGVDPGTTLKAIYTQVGNPEFNNPGGIMAIRVDWGSFGGTIFILAFGTVLGAIYGAFRRNLAVGLLVYPFVLDGILEFPRSFYWTAGRCFPVVLALAWSVYRLRQPKPSLDETDTTPEAVGSVTLQEQID
jgi:oligosaccharide repeat unit polymerase